MADLVFYTNPQSRGRIVRWMLEEVGQPYDTEIVSYDRLKDERYLSVNPMGKVPAIKHRGQSSPNAPRSAPISPTSFLTPALAREIRRRPITTAGSSTLPGRSNRHSPTRRWAGKCRRIANACSATAITSAWSRCSTRCCRCATMSAATASPRPTSMSDRRSCSRCSSGCWKTRQLCSLRRAPPAARRLQARE